MSFNEFKALEICYHIYQIYENLLNSYVSDYYLENHWARLPKSWQESLKNTSMEELGELLDFMQPIKMKIYPLSLLCVRTLIISNTIPRQETFVSKANCAFRNDENFMKFFWKNVKLKKRHEINKMAQICFETAVKTKCFYIVDIGSGLGHLSRMLSFGYGFKVCTFEANSTLSDLSNKMDEEFQKALNIRKVEHRCTIRTVHINKRIEENIVPSDFLSIVKTVFNVSSNEFIFGIVGLHPCGNLGSTLLRLYNECPNIGFINMASCCYMKLTLEPSPTLGFPLSKYSKERHFTLNYLSCEIACHAIENYVEKLNEQKEHNALKIHAYRACLEDIIVSIKSELKHSAVSGVKYKPDLSFQMYCERALKKLGIRPSDEQIALYEELLNRTWKNVVIFYSVRLLLAPLVESIILLDRLLYAKECNSDCDILPVFDCKISPRNHVISARKINKTVIL